MQRPNLLFIYTDEQAAGTMGAYGNPLVETPNMDRLAGESVVFENAYVSQSVCTPSRSTLLTGLYPHTTGCTQNNIPLPAEARCLPELGDFSGYRTAHVGKWHLGDEIFPQHGFREWVSIDDGYRQYYHPDRDTDAHSTYFHWLADHGFEPRQGADGCRSFSRGFCARLPEEFSKPAFVAGQAERFLRDCGQDPFILYVNFFEPHMPYFGPRDGQYDPADIPLPDNFDALPGPEHPLKLRALQRHYERHGHSDLPLETPEDWQRLIANYWGLCSLVDTHLGRILDTLQECGLDESTLVVYTSDHGDMMGSHRLIAKCTQYQEAVKVPLLVRVPGLEPGRVSCPVSQVDLVPTLLDFLGQPPQAYLHGESLRPWMEGREACPERDVLIQWNGPNNGLGDVVGGVSLPETLLELGTREELVASITDPVRTIISPDGWKLNWSPNGEHELYELSEDPGETRNMLTEHGTGAVAHDLCGRLADCMARVGDEGGPTVRRRYTG